MAMDKCGAQFVRYILFAFNLIFSLTGLVIITAGAIVLAEMSDFHSFMESRIIGPPVVLLIAGLTIFVVAFLGCWGAIRESVKMLKAYAVLLLVIFIIEFAIGITCIVAKEEFGISMESEMQNSMKHYKDNNMHKKTWDTLQQKLECCGVFKREEWRHILTNGVLVPNSCCISMEESKCNNKTIDETFNEGCYFKLQEQTKAGAIVLAGIGFGIAFVEIAGIALALLLAQDIRLNIR